MARVGAGLKSYIYIPESLRAAGRHVRLALGSSLDRLTKRDFLRAWCSLVYLFPGLQPTELFNSDVGPVALKKFALEARRRFEAGELTDNELYCYQAATARISREWASLEQTRPWMIYDHFAA
jgi:hypothetical protein